MLRRRGSGWFLGRPTSYYYESPKLGSSGCTVKSCSEAILNIGNPAIWWAFIPAIIVALLVLLLKRDWRFGALLGCVRCGLFPVVYVPDSHDVLLLRPVL